MVRISYRNCSYCATSRISRSLLPRHYCKLQRGFATWPALGVGGEDHRPGPDISRGTCFYEKTRYVYVKYFFNRVHSYKHQQ
ncbi:hypothetical protein Hanom_Chr15g01340801 [Helianthus anomalus]